MRRDEVIHAICEAVDNALTSRDRERLGGSGLNGDTQLLGPGGLLDSVGLVSVVIDVEERLSVDFGESITLADDRAMSEQNSPFRTIGSLADYALQQLKRSEGAI